MYRTAPTRAFALLLLTLAAAAASAQDLKSFEAKTKVHVLQNGWTFIIVERPVAPVFSFATVADVGSAQEVPGITGLAHMFEHMAFKGTEKIGTTDIAAEKTALANVEKHAHAGRARLTLSFMGDVVTLDVRDDGVGFDAARPEPALGGGFGLHGMRQRVARVAGTLVIESEPGGGTAVSARVPAIPTGTASVSPP